MAAEGARPSSGGSRIWAQTPPPPRPAVPPPLPVAAIESTLPAQNQSIQLLALPAGCEYHVFLSHDWGENHINHLFVKRVREKLRSVGISAWFDEEFIHRAPIRKAMSSGIKNSCIVICFVTADYLNKVNQEEKADNCCFEFSSALQQKGSKGMVAVVVDDRCKNTRTWGGTFGGVMWDSIYVDMVVSCTNNGSDNFDAKFDSLHKRIVSEIHSI